MKNDKEYEYRKMIAHLTDDNLFLERKLESLQKEFDGLLNSTSWKITKPLRSFSSLLKRNHKGSEISEVSYFPYDATQVYESEYQENIDFSSFIPHVKAIAFYVSKPFKNFEAGKSLFDGHYMPRVPHKDIGIYEDNAKTLKKQVALAKEHGLYGFSFFYQFDSEKENMVHVMHSSKDIDFPYLICVKNENGDYTQKYDSLISSLQSFFMDKRYIRVDGKPLLMIAHPQNINDFEAVCSKWRKDAQSLGIGDIVIWSQADVEIRDYDNVEFVDGEFDLMPENMRMWNEEISGISGTTKAIDYERFVERMRFLYNVHYALKTFSYSITMGFDNSNFISNDYDFNYHYSLKSFYLWVTLVMGKFMSEENSNTFLFVNAWNDFEHGVYLEPDEAYGYSNINTLSRAIHGIPFEANFKIFQQKYEWKNKKKIAVQCHVFYVDLLNEILTELNKIPQAYDLYISTNTVEKKKEIETILKRKKVMNYQVEVFENRGRDILPMLLQMKDVIQNYDYFLHLHTKKSKEYEYGKNWRNYLYHQLLGSKENIQEIFHEFYSNEKIGAIYPLPNYDVFISCIHPNGNIATNRPYLEQLFDDLDLSYDYITPTMTFPAGSMFWAKTDAIQDLFLKFDEAAFPIEDGQLDGTYAHAVERSIDALAKKNGYETLEILNFHE